MSEEMSPEAMAEAQKANCIFCKIIKGEIPSRKVYEDDLIIAILDINPAVKGHLLLIPKEHYPILPLIPFPITQHLFAKTYDIMNAMKEALLCQNVTVFIANGAVAGQQSPHFLYHLIPRDENDNLNMFTLPSLGDKSANDGLGPTLTQKIGGLMQAYLNEIKRPDLSLAPPEVQRPPVENPVTEEKLNKLIQVINENDDLKEALVNRPDEVKDAVKTNEKWKNLFEGVDIDQLSNNLKALATTKTKPEVPNKEKPDLDKVGELFK